MQAPTAQLRAREARLERAFNDRVRLAGGMTWKLAPTTRGIPDRLAIFPGGRLHLVELKGDGGTLSPAQRHLHARLAALGVQVEVLTGLTDIVAWVTACLDQTLPPDLDDADRPSRPRRRPARVPATPREAQDA